ITGSNQKTAGVLPAGKLSAGERPLLSLPGSAYVKISEGCDNRCSYCAIPLIRGGLKSRAIPDILEECRTLLARGIKELCIIAQDTGSFGRDAAQHTKLPELLNAISSLEGFFWIRLLYIHPDNFPVQILDLMEKDTRFLPYFDIPFQHASEKILSAMNRRGTKENYLELIKTIRTRLPRAVIRSTFLLGFPGETEQDFNTLLDFQKKAALDWLGCFTYSREEDTSAYAMKGQVPKKTAEARKQKVEETQIPITEKNIERFVDQTMDVLIEEQIDGDDNEESFWLGRLYCQAPDIDGAAVIVTSKNENLRIGTFVPCKVTARRGFDLELMLL
ncbi:MAG: MiaB/RimO family radical SAM methylthiotransferase, partial [Treponema sp.]|nr:MiaB/RimO family radical SAM methylthiotransferase [Treponema sp.]